MAVLWCPKCSIPYTESEVPQGVCPDCNVRVGPRSGRGGPAPALPAAPTPAPAPRGAAAPFVLGLVVGSLIGAATLWGAWRPDASPPDGSVEQAAALEAARAQKTEADDRARGAEAGRKAAEADLKGAQAARKAAEAARAEAVKALDGANQRATAALKQKGDVEGRLRDALARLAEGKARLGPPEKALADEQNPRPEPTLSFVRDWQLLGPFASPGGQAHDTVYPPEREAVQLDKAYDGSGGRRKWRPHRSSENRIDLAGFFNYRQAGAAYAVTWVHSDGDRDVTLGVGSDDGIRLWVNGEKVHDVKGGRQARPGQEVVKARLKRGWNEVRAKVDNIVGTWEFYIEFRAANGRDPLKVFSTSSPPPARKAGP